MNTFLDYTYLAMAVTIAAVGIWMGVDAWLNAREQKRVRKMVNEILNGKK